MGVLTIKKATTGETITMVDIPDHLIEYLKKQQNPEAYLANLIRRNIQEQQK
jgi:hypothetical protein